MSLKRIKDRPPQLRLKGKPSPRRPYYPNDNYDIPISGRSGPRSVAPATALGLATDIALGNYYNRGTRQKYFLGDSHSMYSSQLTNYRKRMPPATKKTNTVSKQGPTNRKHKKGGGGGNNKPPTVQKQLNDIRKRIGTVMAKHTYKSVHSAQCLSSVGRCNHHVLNGSAGGQIGSAIANLRYYDPSNPATLVTADATDGTFSRDLTVKNWHQKLVVRNNFLTPAKVKVYLCKIKVDSSSGIKTDYTSGITDQVINAGADETDQLLYLTDIERVRENWNVDCVADKYLHSGDEFEVSHNTGEFQFDSSHYDSETATYQKIFKSFLWLVRVEGPMGHDTVADQRTLIEAGVDLTVYTKVDIQYNAGIALNDIYIDETRAQAWTNAGRVGVRQIPDNINIDRT